MTQISFALSRFRGFAHEHDDIPAFHAAYLVGTFLAAALLNLGFFALLIAVHMCLDYVKYRDLHRYGLLTTMRLMVRESIIDIALFLVALTFAVYLNHSFAIAAISGLARAELTIIRALGLLIPKIEIAEHAISLLLSVERYMHAMVIRPGTSLRDGERWALFAIVVSLSLLALSFVVFHQHQEALMGVFARELSLSL